MLAPPKWVGFRPNRAFLRCPHLLFLPHFSTYIVSVRTAGRRGLSLSRCKIEPLRCPSFRHFAERKCSEIEPTGGGKTAPEGWVSYPTSRRSSSVLPLMPQGIVAFRYSRAQSPQRRVSSLWRCTGATRSAGGAHKPSQGLTRGSTFLGCRVQLRWAVIGGGRPEESLLSTLKFSELLRTTNLVRRGHFMITA